MPQMTIRCPLGELYLCDRLVLGQNMDDDNGVLGLIGGEYQFNLRVGESRISCRAGDAVRVDPSFCYIVVENLTHFPVCQKYSLSRLQTINRKLSAHIMPRPTSKMP